MFGGQRWSWKKDFKDYPAEGAWRTHCCIGSHLSGNLPYIFLLIICIFCLVYPLLSCQMQYFFYVMILCLIGVLHKSLEDRSNFKRKSKFKFLSQTPIFFIKRIENKASKKWSVKKNRFKQTLMAVYEILPFSYLYFMYVLMLPK